MHTISHRIVTAISAVTLPLAITACGIVGPKIDFYDPSIAKGNSDAATVSGSKTQAIKPLSPFLVFLDSIDKKATGRAKTARCNFNTPYPITPGQHELLAVVSVGEPYAYGRFAIVPLQVSATPKSNLVLRGEAYSADSAAVWVSDASGTPVTDKIPVTLKDNPGKSMPIGFAAIDDSCSLP